MITDCAINVNGIFDGHTEFKYEHLYYLQTIYIKLTNSINIHSIIEADVGRIQTLIFFSLSLDSRDV